MGKNKHVWSTDMATHLILLYESKPCLYDVRSKDYHNRNSRNKALNEICASLSEMYPKSDLSESIVKAKIHGIRSQYTNELNKIKKSEASGVAPDDVYEPKLWCFDMMGFLNDSCNVITQGESNLNTSQTYLDNEENSAENEILFAGSIDELSALDSPDVSRPGSSANVENITPTISRPCSATSTHTLAASKPPNSKKRKSQDSQLEGLLTTATHAINKIGEQDEKVESDLDIFGRYLVSELNKIESEPILNNLKQKILLDVFKAKDEDYKNRNNL